MTIGAAKLFYDSPSPAPNPRRVRIYLAEKGLSVPSETVHIMKGEHKAPPFIDRYPPGQLPVLELEDGTMIGETVAICRYFEALNPEPPLFGRDPLSIAQTDMWTRRVEMWLGYPLAQVWIHTHPLTARIVKPQYSDYGESNRPRVAAAMERMDARFAESPYLAGEDFSIADIVLLTTIDFAGFIGMPVPDELTALRDWHGRVSARPSASA